MFRAPFDSFEINEQSEPYINQLLSDESVERAGYFQPNAIRYWRDRAKAYRQNAPIRTTLEMGLVGVLATQLWHHLYIDPNLCELPDWKSLKPDVRVATVPCEKQS